MRVVGRVEIEDIGEVVGLGWSGWGYPEGDDWGVGVVVVDDGVWDVVIDVWDWGVSFWCGNVLYGHVIWSFSI